jgi:hypothetical protein
VKIIHPFLPSVNAMSDRLTELQMKLEILSQMFYTCLGVIQRDAAAPPEKERFEEQIRDMSVQIVSTVKGINVLIESLPGIDSTEEQQMETLSQLELQSNQAADELKKKVQEAEMWLKTVQDTLNMITSDKLNE